MERLKSKVKAVMLAVSAFTVGASVMCIEITASRVLAPYFGASMFVWTALIVTVLLSMSIGYWWGGRLTERFRDTQMIGLLLCGASALLMAGMWATGGMVMSIPDLLAGIGGATFILFGGSFLVSFLVFSLPVLMLAMAGPFILAKWTEDRQDVGVISGRYFAVSTIGSVIGTIAPTLVLVPEFGVKVTMVSVSVLLGMLGLLFMKGVLRPVAACIIILAVTMVVHQDRFVPDTVVFENESPYQLIRVRENEGVRYLTFNEASGIQSVYDPKGGRTGYYYDSFAAVPFLSGEEVPQTDAAILGLAGGSLVRQLMSVLPEGSATSVTGVEIDGEVISAAREFFALDDLDIDIVNRDGREFIAASDRSFDTVVIDAYSTQMYIPAHMTTQEFFVEVRGHLTEDGFTVMNINAPRRDSRLLMAMTNTIASVFPYAYIAKAGNSWNWLVVAGDTIPNFAHAAEFLPEGYEDVAGTLQSASRIVYDPNGELFTDDWAPIEHMTDGMLGEEIFGG
jgi:spermidine synthase